MGQGRPGRSIPMPSSAEVVTPFGPKDRVVPVAPVRTNQAPGVKLLFTPWRGPAIADEKGLAATDFIITSVERPFQGFSPEQLYEDTDVVAVRTGHRAREKLSTRSSFSNAQHIAIVGSGELEDVSEPWLRSVGLVRQIALQVPTYLLALRIVSQTDLVAFVPRGLARSMARSLKLTTVACPVDPGSDQMMLWTATRLAGDPAASWMRSRLRALFDNAD